MTQWNANTKHHNDFLTQIIHWQNENKFSLIEGNIWSVLFPIFYFYTISSMDFFILK